MNEKEVLKIIERSYKTGDTRLDLIGKQLSTLPPEIGKLTHLKALDLEGNKLITLPPDIGNLINLEELYLQKNMIETLPTEIANLANLKWLDMEGNKLSSLPVEIKNLDNLASLYLDGNQLPIPPEILKLRTEPTKIINFYLQHKSKETQSLNEAKILIVGQAGVGKTSLVKKIKYDTFNQDEGMTEGINIEKWIINVNRTRIGLNIWDFGGQEIMHATHQFFLTKRSLYMLVLDSRLDANENVNNIEYWLKLIQSFGGDSPIIVVCNKSDERQISLNWEGLRNKYPTIRYFAKHLSCKNGDGIEELKDRIAQEIEKLKHIHDELPKSWFNIKARLENMEENYISYLHYQDICSNEEINSTESQTTLIGFLHDLGIVLRFSDYRLQDTNILNPEWVTVGVYKILTSKILYEAKGRLKLEDLDSILDPKNYPKEKHMFIIEMIKKFELCFDFTDYANTQFLIPDLLYRDEPYTGKWENTLDFQYHYDILPDSVISRFIVKMHTKIKKNTYWRYGVVLEDNNEKNTALVKADKVEKKVYIYIEGKQKTRREFLGIIRSHFDDIHISISSLKVEQKVPVPDHPEVVIDYQHLLNLEEMGVETIIPEKLKEEYSVTELLNGIEPESDRKKRTKHTKEEKKQSKNPYTIALFLATIIIALLGAFGMAANFLPSDKLSIVVLTVISIFSIIIGFIAYSNNDLSFEKLLDFILELFKKFPGSKSK